MKKLNTEEIKNLILVKLVLAKIAVNEYGLNDMLEELEYYQEEQEVECEQQLDYIINQAIPDGSRDNYFYFLELN